MVDRGAGHLILVGRKGSASLGAKKLLKSLRSSGIQVDAIAADISDLVQVKTIFDNIQKQQLKLRGVMHAAGVLDDGSLLEMNDEKYQCAIAPKALAAWHIHRQTESISLDFMVMFSSITTLIGNPGQANYVAANTWLDVLAHYRRSKGLAAISVNWGLIADVGFAVRNKDIIKHFDRLGVRGLPPKLALESLGYVMRWNPVQIGIADMDWDRLFGANNPRFSLLKSNTANKNSETESLKQELKLLDSANKVDRIANDLIKYAASSLELLPEQLKAEHKLSAFGLDSLVAVELQMQIQIGFGIEMSMLELMMDQNINRMSKVILKKMGLGGT